MSWSVEVENMSCGGCVNSITKGLHTILGVGKVQVDLDKGIISLEGEFDEQHVLDKLSKMGYPQKGNNTLIKQAKSFVSCATGKISSSEKE
jgi:copper chaperone CopZ